MSVLLNTVRLLGKAVWASLGTFAGAIGSSFDNDDAIREGTYSRREHVRRQIVGLYEDKPPSRFVERRGLR